MCEISTTQKVNEAGRYANEAKKAHPIQRKSDTKEADVKPQGSKKDTLSSLPGKPRSPQRLPRTLESDARNLYGGTYRVVSCRLRLFNVIEVIDILMSATQ